MVSRPELGSDPLIGLDRESGCDIIRLEQGDITMAQHEARFIELSRLPHS